MIEVEITNFKSIAHVKFVVDGFTTITGPNALGKSNVLRAINAALTNQQGTDLISWGEKFCEVRLIMDGLDILWHKEESNNYYVINEVTYKKIGRDEPPAEILQAGFRPIKTSSQKINLNYASQFYPLFLVESLDSKGADLLTSVYGLDRLYKAMDLCSKAQRENSDELRLREKDLDIVNKDLVRFTGLGDVVALSSSLKETKTKLSVEETLIAVMKARYDKVQELVVACKKLQTIKSVVLPDSKPIDKSAAVYKQITGYYDSLSKITEAIKKLKGITDVALPPDVTQAILSKIAECKKLRTWQQRHELLTAETVKLSPIGKVTLPVCHVDLTEITRLRQYYDSAIKQKREVISLKTDLDQSIAERVKAEEEKNKFDVCPACGRPKACPSCGKPIE